MRTWISLIVLLSFATTPILNAQKWWGGGVDGKGPRVERDLQLDDFDGIRLTLSADVYLTPGRSQSVRVSAQQNIIDLLKTDVDGGVWKISTEENIDDHSKIKIYITVPEMTYVKLSGSGNIYTEGTFDNSGEEVEIGISGSGNLEFNTNARSIEAGISGSGDIELDGSTDDINVGISGSGDIDAMGMTARNAQIRISGSGNAKVHATQGLNVRVSGSGDVYYRGNPNVQSRISGSGDLESVSGR